ncbi:MAG: SGNH/GDSL hydrolase family protein [Ferruginibacter sp.]
MEKINKKYLALGDSYTIGEQVLPENSFPYQLTAILNKDQHDFYFDDPEIIARTGWTTDELQAAIDVAQIDQTYDLVTLLIGVNNQYRGRTVDEYQLQFKKLLMQAIDFAGGKTSNVFVLSIPDWGVTPFAEGRNKEAIALEIDAFNAAAENTCRKNQVTFIDITTGQRTDGSKKDFLAEDGLHPSGKEYAKWVQEILVHGP